jgi:hypothetical protein
MATKQATRSTAWFWICIVLAVYVLVSAGLAVATADACDGGLDGDKNWQPFPPRWECPRR